jgi:hypothetical protein
VNGLPTNPSLTTWALNPYVEANYIFLGDAEVVQLAKSDNSFVILDNRAVSVPGLYGAGNDIELTLVNLCTRIVWVAQRSDASVNNEYDNYTNQYNPQKSRYNNLNITPWYSTGPAIGENQSSPDILIDGTIIFDGAERFNRKTEDFFQLLENYRHHKGEFIPGINTYSFAIDHDKNQPSGHVNGSMFNKTLLRLTLQDPNFTENPNSNQACIVKSTTFNQAPTVVRLPENFASNQVVSVITKGPPDVRVYTYNVRAYVESYDFLRITRGIANVMFSS